MFFPKESDSSFRPILFWSLLVVLSFFTACNPVADCGDKGKQQAVFERFDFVTLRDHIDSIANVEKLDSCCALVLGIKTYQAGRELVHSEESPEGHSRQASNLWF